MIIVASSASRFSSQFRSKMQPVSLQARQFDQHEQTVALETVHSNLNRNAVFVNHDHHPGTAHELERLKVADAVNAVGPASLFGNTQSLNVGSRFTLFPALFVRLPSFAP